MTNEDRNKQDQVEHSLPGTNQAGKGPDSTRKGDDEQHRSGAEIGRDNRELEKHSLPGTNQAGKGAGSSGKDDHNHKPAD